MTGSEGETRTLNPAVNSRVLCQLSYLGLKAENSRQAVYLVADLPTYISDRIVIADSGCWEWIGDHDGHGYGRCHWHLPEYPDLKRWRTHRLVYTLLAGPIRIGFVIDHLCRNTKCVKPSHLEPVTNRENIRRGISADQWRNRTHCPRHHPYDERNTSTSTKGGRICRTCARDRMRARRHPERLTQPA